MSVFLAVSLLITPAPFTARQETPLWTAASAAVSIAVGVPTISPSLIEASFEAESSYVATEPPAPNEPPVAVPDIPPPAPPPELTLRERALNRLSELGAPQWVVNGFDCIGFRESHWTNLRSKTGDSGVLQENDVHLPELRRLGLDPWIPEDAAEFAWILFTRAGWSWRDWVTAPGCGLR